MAVIREKRQFQIGPVGVARASRGGVIVGEAIAKAGAQAQQRLAQRAAEDARKAGIEYAQGLERSEIIELDPVTGRPKIYEGPKGFGRIAQNAYQQVLLQRFETEIGTEIEDKSKELAIQFSKSPEGFRQAMSDYVAEMSNVEESTVFKQVIQSVGTNVQSSKYRALQLQAQARQEKNDQLAYANSSTENLSSIEDAYAVGNFDLGEQLAASGVNLDGINVQAGTILPNATLGNDLKRDEAKARGILRYELYKATKEGVSDYDLQQALVAIDSGDLSRMPSGVFTDLTKMLGGRGSSFRESIAQFGTELITDGINQVRLDREIKTRQRQATAAASQYDLTEEYFDILGSSSWSLTGSVADAVDNYLQDRELGLNAFRNGATQQEVESYTMESAARLQSMTSALTSKLFAMADSVDGVVDIQRFLKNPTDENKAKLNPEAASLAASLLSVAEQTNQMGLIEAADKYAESISDETRVLENKRYQDAAIAYNSYLKDEFYPSFSIAKTTAELEDVINQRDSELYLALSPEAQETYKGQIKNFVSGQYLRVAFSTSADPRVTSQMAQYARDQNFNATLLSDEQKKAIDIAIMNSDDPSNFTTNLNEYAKRANERYETNIQNIKDRKLFTDVLNNARDTSDLTAAERAKLDQQLSIPSDFYTNPDYSDDARTNAIVQQISPSYWPQAQYDTINSFLAGRTTDEGEVKRVLSTYRSARSYVTDAGFEIDSGGLSGLSADQIALMNAAVSFAETNSDPQAMMQHLQQVSRSIADPNLSKDMDAFFTRKASSKENRVRTENVEQYISANYPESLTNPNLFARLVSAAKVHYFESISETRDDKRFDQIDDVLQGVIDNQFVEDERIITSAGSNKTLYPLSSTVNGFEDDFMSYVRKSMSQMTTDKNIDWNTAEFKLMPVGFNSDDRGMTYGVVIVDEAGVRNLQEVEIYVDENDEPVVIPAFFSTNEPIFSAYKTKKTDKDKEDAVTEGNRRATSLEEMQAGYEEISEALVGPKGTSETDLTFINPLGGMTFMPTPQFMEEREQFFADKEKKVSETQQAIAPLMSNALESGQFKPLFERLPLSVSSNYRKLLQASPTSIPRMINKMLDQVSTLNDPMANEFELHLKSLLEALSGS